jgi:hypothetical protein
LISASPCGGGSRMKFWESKCKLPPTEEGFAHPNLWIGFVPARSGLADDTSRETPVAVNCHDFKSLMGDFLDQEMAEEICRDVHSHLEACGPCSVEVDTIRKTILIYKNASPCPEMTEDARKRLFAILSYEYKSGKRLDSA